MRDITIRIGIDQIAEIEEFNLVVEFSMDRIAEVDWVMDRGIGMTMEEEISEVTWECIKAKF